MKVILYKSNLKNKKYKAVIFYDNKKKTIQFGSNGMSDYTIHKDDDRKKKYIIRHQKRENWNNIKTAGAWSKNLLWNKKTISASIKDMEKRFKINIVNKII
jgi:hypothetical protein